MWALAGLFSKKPRDPQLGKNAAKLKEFKGLVKRCEYPQALAAGAEYLKNVPHNHDVLFTVGGIYYVQKKYRVAISYLDRALEIGSYDTEALLLKAYAHQKLGERGRVVSCCEKIREVDPKNKKVSELLDS
ncbi:MAG: hypothetical protein EB829_00890 [Nitrosopumilus sp. H8]|nr:MAG: hypothetical protein EB830_06180 [Nitrosopumilus sp. H13]RNJ80013.1 MAG: hypothetical protein EB829_00890 [Nitrosopumilus sp. H8]